MNEQLELTFHPLITFNFNEIMSINLCIIYFELDNICRIESRRINEVSKKPNKSRNKMRKH